MNATVKRIVELMFQDTEMTDEVKALQEELLNNCPERFEDRMAQGCTEDEAIAAVVESLKGMQEVIDGYPKKPAPKPELGANATMEGENCVYRFDAATVQRITCDVVNEDVHFVPTSKAQLAVRYDPEDVHVTVTQQGNVVSIKRNANKNSAKSWSFGSILHIVHYSSGGDITIEIPEGMHPDIAFHGISGDVELAQLQPQSLVLETTGGDIDVAMEPNTETAQVRLATGSGDIQGVLYAAQATLQSLSGDVRMSGECAELTVSSVSGDVQVAGEMARVRMKSVSGDMLLRAGSQLCEVQAQSTSGDVDIFLPEHTDSVHVNARSISGDVQSRFPDLGEASSVKVTANSVSGDILVR